MKTAGCTQVGKQPNDSNTPFSVVSLVMLHYDSHTCAIFWCEAPTCVTLCCR